METFSERGVVFSSLLSLSYESSSPSSLCFEEEREWMARLAVLVASEFHYLLPSTPYMEYTKYIEGFPSSSRSLFGDSGGMYLDVYVLYRLFNLNRRLLLTKGE